VKDFYLLFAGVWIVLAGVRFYRAYSGTLPGWMVTLNHSPATMSKKARWVNAALGICNLGFGVGYMVLRHGRHF
jgi:hypothetical protein